MSPLGDVVVDRVDRRLSSVSKIAAGLALAFTLTGWVLWEQRGRASPLLVAAAVLLTSAAVTGVIGPRRAAPQDHPDRDSLDRKSLTASTQSLLLELGLLAAVTWLVDLTLRTLMGR